MSKYIVYRCALCGELIYRLIDSEEIVGQEEKFINHVFNSQHFAGLPSICKATTHLIHHCECDRFGVAYFAGIRNE